MEKIIIFAKAPKLGAVKTRLAGKLGPVKALEIYQELLARTISAARSFAQVEIRFTPDDAGEAFTPMLQKGWVLKVQGDGSLGNRLQRALEESFAAGAEKVAVVGSDCPYLLKKDFQKCWTSLNQNDLVLGPAMDGGYWLIGMNKLHRSLFEEIPWSTDDVLAQTLARGKSLGLKMDLLRILSDIDTLEDWEQYQASRESR